MGNHTGNPQAVIRCASAPEMASRRTLLLQANWPFLMLNVAILSTHRVRSI
jgi:hypothetical protein